MNGLRLQIRQMDSIVAPSLRRPCHVPGLNRNVDLQENRMLYFLTIWILGFKPRLSSAGLDAHSPRHG